MREAVSVVDVVIWLFSNKINAVDAVAIIVQIHLQQNRTDLAVKEVAAARRWAQDSLLVNLAESWVGVRVVSRGMPATSLIMN